MPSTSHPCAETFEARAPIGGHGCWEWPGHCNRDGYGVVERTDLQRAFAARREVMRETTGWVPGCSCGADEEHDGYMPVACTVLDPFMGSGTTALVARKMGRRAVGVELNPAYLEIARERLAQQSLFA